MPVKRWIPRCNGALVRHSELQRSCSSPPPTSTAPTSVISHASPDETVGLGVDDQELRGRDGGRQQLGNGDRARHPTVIRPDPDGMGAGMQELPSGFLKSSAQLAPDPGAG